MIIHPQPFPLLNTQQCNFFTNIHEKHKQLNLKNLKYLKSQTILLRCFLFLLVLLICLGASKHWPLDGPQLHLSGGLTKTRNTKN